MLTLYLGEAENSKISRIAKITANSNEKKELNMKPYLKVAFPRRIYINQFNLDTLRKL